MKRQTKPKKSPKLELVKEVVRALDTQKLQHAAGGSSHGMCHINSH
jgi:hypothetical protein